MRVGLLCGLTLSLANFLKCITFDGLTVNIAAVVCLTIICAVFLAKLLASTLVLLLTKFKLDPAVVASPMLTTIIDALSLLIYFSIATAILGI